MPKKSKCPAVLAGAVAHKGKPSAEWKDKGGKIRYYCYGYVDQATDWPISECETCPKHWTHAQEDMDKHYGRDPYA